MEPFVIPPRREPPPLSPFQRHADGRTWSPQDASEGATHPNLQEYFFNIFNNHPQTIADPLQGTPTTIEQWLTSPNRPRNIDLAPFYWNPRENDIQPGRDFWERAMAQQTSGGLAGPKQGASLAGVIQDQPDVDSRLPRVVNRPPVLLPPPGQFEARRKKQTAAPPPVIVNTVQQAPPAPDMLEIIEQLKESDDDADVNDLLFPLKSSRRRKDSQAKMNALLQALMGFAA